MAGEGVIPVSRESANNWTLHSPRTANKVMQTLRHRLKAIQRHQMATVQCNRLFILAFKRCILKMAHFGGIEDVITWRGKYSNSIPLVCLTAILVPVPDHENLEAFLHLGIKPGRLPQRIFGWNTKKYGKFVFLDFFLDTFLNFHPGLAVTMFTHCLVTLLRSRGNARNSKFRE